MLSPSDYGLLVERQDVSAAIWKWKNEELCARDDQVIALAHYRAETKVSGTLLDLLYRLRAANQAKNDSFALPLTQEEFGSALGLSVVHVNRVLSGLKRVKLIATDRHRITVLDTAHLAKLAQRA